MHSRNVLRYLCQTSTGAHAYTHVHAQNTFTRIHPFMHTGTHTRTHIHTYVCVHARAHVCVYWGCSYVCVCVCAWSCACVCVSWERACVCGYIHVNTSYQFLQWLVNTPSEKCPAENSSHVFLEKSTSRKTVGMNFIPDPQREALS